MYPYAGDASKPISGAWKVLYALSLVGTVAFLVLNVYFAEQFAREQLDCLTTSRHASYSSYSYSSYNVCEYAGRSYQTLASLTSGCAWIAIVAMFVWAAAWLGSAFGALPTYARKTSPALAGFSLLIPLFNIYAMFAMPIEFCRGVEQVATRQQSPARAPMVLAIIAAVCTLIPPIWLVAAILWIVFMAMAEGAMKKLSSSVAPAVAPAFAPVSAYGATTPAPATPQPGAVVYVRDGSGQEVAARVVAQAPGHVQVTLANGMTTWVAEGNVRWM